MKETIILLVEDDEALLEGMHDLLELSGYHVMAAENGLQALNMLEQTSLPPHLIVSDIMMPDMDGYQFLEAVRERDRWKSIPFIFLTAKSTRQDVRSGKTLGADDYISKPFEADDLLVAIESLLKRQSELEELRESRFASLKRRILAAINHEFRTPLSYVVAYSDMILSGKDGLDPQELRDYLLGIQRGSERLLSLVENLLLLIELESGQGMAAYRLRKSTILNLHTLIEETVGEFQERAEIAGVELVCKAPSQSLPIEGDVHYLSSALAHLIDNGIKFTKEYGSRVEVSLDIEDGKVVIIVQDDGMGIDKQQHERLFETFYQADRDKFEQQGVGAGLAIVSHVVHLHGGHIDLDSEVGKGTRFTLSIPLLHEVEESSS